ncbi:MAG: DNA polymerase/3'-5' exonuclease PolX [Candidatus Micrarchaeaceae archaeon]
MGNKAISAMLDEIADMLEVSGGKYSRFEIRAYRAAALTIGTLQEPVEELYKKGGTKALMDLPGIGSGIAKSIEEYIKTGKMSKYEKLKKKFPIDFASLKQIEGLGPKKIYSLYSKLGVKDIPTLKKAAELHKIMELEGFGQRSEMQIAESLALLESNRGRILLGEALPVAEAMVKKLLSSGLVGRAFIAGSLSRMRETVGDIDLLVTSTAPEKVMELFSHMDGVVRTISSGPSKSTVWLDIGISCDLRVIDENSFGSAQQYFIGSKAHNIAVRTIAIKKGYKLNEYGLFDKNGKVIASQDESQIYSKLGMQHIPYEMREDRGEIELALKHSLPKLVELGDIKGDMHTHTKETDGKNTIEEMAQAAIARGYEYIATTNHTKSLKVARGMDELGFRKFFEKVDALNEKLDGKLIVLKGAEVDILKDGSLDLDEQTLDSMDCVVAAVHSSLNMPLIEMTKRVRKALDSGYVNILAHPTGRLIGEREPYQIDLDDVAQSAKDNSVALEVNSFMNRLDLNDTNILSTSRYGTYYSINTDAHSTEHLSMMRYGVGTARRGWLGPDRILNSMKLSGILKFLKK